VSTGFWTLAREGSGEPQEGQGAGVPSWSFEVFSQGHERARLGESPCWAPETNALWWVDVTGKRLLRTELASGESEGWQTPEFIGFVALLGPNTPVVGMETGIFRFTPETAAFERVVAFDVAGCRFNDATVDAKGRLWVSTMALDAAPRRAAVHLVTPALGLETFVGGLAIPNGLAVDLERGRLLYSDSHPDVQRIWSLPLDGDARPTGEASDHADTKALRGRPDGAALGSDGSHWIAGVDGGELYVFDTAGELVDSIPLPVPAPTKLCFAGDDGRTVVVTSKGIGESGGYLARARMPPGLSTGTVQPYWMAGAA
jgi:xylono-1,5-lactonase